MALQLLRFLRGRRSRYVSCLEPLIVIRMSPVPASFFNCSAARGDSFARTKHGNNDAHGQDILRRKGFGRQDVRVEWQVGLRRGWAGQ